MNHIEHISKYCNDSEILDIEPFEIRKFDGYVELNEPFYECSAVINWDKSE